MEVAAPGPWRRSPASSQPRRSRSTAVAMGHRGRGTRVGIDLARLASPPRAPAPAAWAAATWGRAQRARQLSRRARCHQQPPSLARTGRPSDDQRRHRALPARGALPGTRNRPGPRPEPPRVVHGNSRSSHCPSMRARCAIAEDSRHSRGEHWHDACAIALARLEPPWRQRSRAPCCRVAQTRAGRSNPTSHPSSARGPTPTCFGV